MKIDQQPLISIVMPAYNREKFLSQSVSSVINQTYQNWELIIVDDRSTDNTARLIQNHTEKDKRIRYIKNTHRHGPGGARNQGLEMTRGEYIAFLDSDDEWVDFHLKKMLYYLTKYPDKIDLMVGDVVRKNKQTGKVYMRSNLDVSKYGDYKLGEAYILNPDPNFSCHKLTHIDTIVSRKNALKEIKFDEDLFGPDDSLFELEITYNKVKIGYLPECHAVYWAHKDNIVNALGLQSINQRIKVNLEFIKYYTKILQNFKLSKKQKRIMRKEFANRYFWNLGYCCYLENNRYKEANNSFLKALMLNPFDCRFWKTYIARIVLKMPLK